MQNHHESLPPDAAEFLSMYDSLGPAEQEDMQNLLEKWSDSKPRCRQLATILAGHEKKQQANGNNRNCEVSQQFKRALERMPTAQGQLEMIDRITRTLIKSLTQPDYIATCTLLRDSIRDIHFSVFDLNSSYRKYQEAFVEEALRG